MTTHRQPGWYDDPNDSNAQRYWDGQGWTPHRQRKPLTRQTQATPNGDGVGELAERGGGGESDGGRRGMGVTEGANHGPREPRPKSGWKALAIIVLILLLIGGCGGVVAYITHPTTRWHGLNGSGSRPATSTRDQGQPVPPPTSGMAALDIDGTYLMHFNWNCAPAQEATFKITHQGNTLTIDISGAPAVASTVTGTVDADGSFSVSYQGIRMKGAFATEGGRAVMRGVEETPSGCTADFVGTKQ